jgi:electron transfer flavoprotein beta subunit
MKITVCIKQVPGTTQVEIDPVTGVLKRDGVESKMNPYDLYALETALRIKEMNGAEITVVTMGPPQAQAVIREAFMMGVDHGYLLSDRQFGGSDVLATSYTIAQGIKASGGADLIICGKQTTDGDTAQVGAEVAEFLNLPNVSNVLSVDEVSGKSVKLKASLDEKIVDMEVKLPCLISVDGDINSPRLPSYKVKQNVTDEMVTFISFDDFLDKNPDNYGLSG